LDDALAAQSAGVTFLGVLPHGSEAHRVRAKQLRSHGARAILHHAKDLERYWK
jgi:phosphoglycolate phosphatase-like HAD superfamily hydrolase